MKILEVCHRFPPAIGGSEKVVHELSKQFKNKGHDVTVITSTSLTNNDTRGFSTGRFFSFQSKNKKSYKENVEGIKIFRFQPLFQLFPYSFNPQMKRFLKNNINKYDIVHVHGYQTYEADIVSKYSKKYILTAHDIIAHYDGVLGFLKNIFDSIIGRRILKRAKNLIALTPENIKQYNEIINCKNKIELIPNGIEKIRRKNVENLKKQFNNPKKIILFVARLVKYKGAQHIIKAAKEILKNEPSTSFVFVGEDQGYGEELKKIAKENNVENNCFFTGKVPSVDDYYSLADIFVLASTGEGFGLTAVEAMSLGIPSILADMGGLKYVLKEIGGYPLEMEANIHKQIAEHVKDIFDDKKIKEKMEKIIEKIKNYTWDKISDKTLELFEK